MESLFGTISNVNSLIGFIGLIAAVVAGVGALLIAISRRQGNIHIKNTLLKEAARFVTAIPIVMLIFGALLIPVFVAPSAQILGIAIVMVVVIAANVFKARIEGVQKAVFVRFGGDLNFW